MHTTSNPGSVHRVGPALAWALCACIGLASTTSWADDDDPASRVARISYLKGPVYVQTADDKAWTDADINRPLTSGDQLWTDSQGRSELQMGSTTVQVDANTQLRVSELSDDVLQLVVTQGVVNVRVRHLDKNDSVEIDTPNAAVTAVEPGTYRIEVADHDDLTVVQVREGKAQIAGEKQDFTLREDEQLSLRGTQHLTAEFDELAHMDEFDRWALERNDRAERVASSRYVDAEVIGYEDLDDYGYWRWYSDYGYVWMPTRINAGWAPYRFGHWFWVSPWGWTWIDDAPWGFAPFHYGRWAMLNSHWCWVPGPRTARAIYAPALVAWVGTPGINVSINVGHHPVGWIPLGPREVYRPYYRGSHDYVTRVNLSNSLLNSSEFERGYRRQPHDNDYRNRNAASVVQADTLRDARPVNNHLIHTRGDRLQPLTTQPVARPDHDESSNRLQPPPVVPNTRDVLTRRQFETRDRSNNERSRGDEHPRVDKPGAVRPSNLDVWGRSTETNDAANVERINSRSDDGRATDARDRGFPHTQSGRNRDEAIALPTAQTARSIATPSTRSDAAPPQRNERPANMPTATNAAPEVAPRARHQAGVRDEIQLGRRDTNGIPPERHAEPMERGRTMTVPNNPAPIRSAPAPRQATPMQVPTAPSEAARQQRGRNRDRDDR